MQFNEHQLELSIMELFENEGYTHQTGNDIHREKTDVLLPELLSTFLLPLIYSHQICVQIHQHQQFHHLPMAF